jgi:hypothetical protein
MCRDILLDRTKMGVRVILYCQSKMRDDKNRRHVSEDGGEVAEDGGVWGGLEGGGDTEQTLPLFLIENNYHSSSIKDRRKRLDHGQMERGGFAGIYKNKSEYKESFKVVRKAHRYIIK